MSSQSHHILICLASNSNQKQNMQRARELLTTLLPDIHYTTEHWTQPVGSIRTDLYLNQLASGITTLSLEELNAHLKEIEQLLERKHDKSGIVTIDIDLLQYDEERLHLRDWERDYVKDLIKEI